jgi:hypothetical protein
MPKIKPLALANGHGRYMAVTSAVSGTKLPPGPRSGKKYPLGFLKSPTVEIMFF